MTTFTRYTAIRRFRQQFLACAAEWETSGNVNDARQLRLQLEHSLADTAAEFWAQVGITAGMVGIAGLVGMIILMAIGGRP